MPHATTRPVLSVSSRRRIEASKQKPGQKPKKEDGSNRRKLEQHEAALIPSIRAGRPITIVLIDGDRLIDVTPIGFDRYTIGVEYDGFRETVFKSAIARIIFSEEYSVMSASAVIASLGAAAVAAPASGPSPFEPEFETKIVAHVLRDATFMQQCEELVAPDFFSEQSARYLVSIAKKHYRKYESVPSSRTLVKYVKDAIKTGRIKKAMVPDIQALLKEAFEEPLSDSKFVTEEVSTFARHRALQKMMEKVIDDMEKAETTGVALDYGEIEKHMKDVVMIGANDASNGYDFFANIAERTEVREEIASGKIKPGERSITTGYPAFDSLLYHKGWGRKEMVVFMGPPKSGKSTALGQFAINASIAGYDTLYITLEVSDQVMSDRMDASMSGTPMAELTDRSSMVREEIEKLAASSGKLILHQYPTGSFTPNQLVRLIEHYKARGTVFDMVVVDYGDIMAPNYRTNDPIENSKSIYVDLRAAAMAYDVALLTATQTNRDGAKAAVATMTEVAEDFNKIRIADLVISINKSEEEKANQEARLYFAASRNQKSDICIRVKQDLERMQFLKKIIDVT